MSSVFAQDVDCWTLTIIDGSPLEENISEQLLALTNEKVNYVRNTKDICIAGNWNMAFEQLQSGLFCLLHEDDVLHSQYVRKMLLLANEFPKHAMYYCGSEVINEAGVKKTTVAGLVKQLIAPKAEPQHLMGDQGLDTLLKGCFIYCPTVVYNRITLANHRFDAAWHMVLDLEFYARALMADFTITGTSNVLFSYRRHANSQTSQLSLDFKRYEEEIYLYNQLSSLAIQKQWTSSAIRAQSKTIIKLHLWFNIVCNLLTFNVKEVCRILKFMRRHF